MAPGEGGAGRRGILWMVLTALMFSTSDVLVKHLTETYPVVQVVWARFAFHLVFFALLMNRRLPAVLVSRRPRLQGLRSLLLVAATTFLFLGLHVIPLADLTAIMFLTPLVMTALALPILGEPVSGRAWAGVGAGFVGAIVIIRPGLGILQAAALLPLSAAFCFGLYQLTTRMASRTDGALTSMAYAPIAGTIGTSALVYFFWTLPDGIGWLLLATLGILGGASQFCLIRAVEAAPAATVAPFLYTTIVWAVIFGYFLFDEFPDPWTFLGAAIILVSSFYVFRREPAGQGGP